MTARAELRSWRDHLAPGCSFDPVGGVEPVGLPAAWAKTWSAAPQARLLRAVGSDDDRWVTAGEVAERSAAVAARLARLGVGPGSVVLWSPTRSVDAVLSHVGALRAGATVVPVNPAATERELRFLVGDVAPVAAFTAAADSAASLADGGVPLVLDHGVRLLALAGTADGAASRPASRPGSLPDCLPDSLPGSLPEAGPLHLDAVGDGTPALIAYTSGTTGSPKGAVLSHANVLANSKALAAAWRWEPDDRLVHVLPLFHGHGLCAALYTSLLVGASTVLLPGFDLDAVCRASSAEEATLFFGVPTMYHRVAAAGRASELSGLRLAVSGSAPLAAGLHAAMASAGTVVLERYGMTETLLTVSNPADGERRAGTVGFPLPGVDAEIDDQGQLLIRGPQVFAGYLGRPVGDAQTFVGGWFATGDLVEVTDGYLRIVGRQSDLVISGGFNVYPAEVEEVLLRHPGVAEVAVAGTPSDEWGEVVTAWVVPDGSGLDTESLLRFAAEQLTPYKRPRLVRLVDALPRNAMGKVVRSELT